jgi:Tectonin domain/Astacin (Peptidase family M12A)
MTGASSGNGRAQSEELRGSPEMGVAVIAGATFAAKSVTYYNVHGIAIVEGDIALGTVENVRAATERARQLLAAGASAARAIGITGSQFRWPGCQVPFEIDPALPNPERVTNAIAHWEANTPFRFPRRTPQNAAQHPNYVRFTDDGGCWSLVGMQGGEQTISLGPECSIGNAKHEIGHAIGLWHEQSREDRDLFVTIHWEHIEDGMAANFNQHITDGDDLGAYDYGSIMHYPRNAFSRDWDQVPGSLKQISVGNASSVWGVNSDDEIYRRDGNSWTQVPGSLKQISVGNASSVWGVNSDDEIYRRDGNSWTQIPGSLKHVSVANDDTVWGVNSDDEIYRRDGNSWTQIPGSLKQISVGNASSVWGVNSDDEIYRRDGNSWTQIPGSLKHVSVANDDTVWGVNDDDEIYRPDGNSWTQIPGSLKQISSGAANIVWGVNANDRIFKLR